MRLIKLDIKGFKSFGDKVTIHFDRGITGVVGPNGCGKSNVIDAMRWVLGEQSTKNLRSDKMDNIIFNGSATRKPANAAEVHLTFENDRNILPAEYTDVSIGRRYDRQGNSEYYLNNTLCRRRDITDLLQNTGISASSYAIIELKMVDDILNDREGSRKAMIEEAAGVAKFKAKKKEALQKMQEVQDDLVRVEDLLAEIIKNVRALERQAKAAEKAQSIRERYKQLSVALAKKLVRANTEEFFVLNNKVQNEQQIKAEFVGQIEEQDKLLEELKAQSNAKENFLNAKKSDLANVFYKIRTAEGDIKLTQERLKYLTDKKDNLRWQIDQNHKEEIALIDNVRKLEEDKTSQELNYNTIERQLSEFKTVYEGIRQENDVLKKELEQSERYLKNKQNDLFLFRKDFEVKELKQTSFKQDLERIALDTQAFETQIAELSDALHQLNSQINAQKTLLDQAQAHEEALKQQIAVLESEVALTRDEQAAALRRYDAKFNELKLAKALAESLEGYSDAVKFLNEQPQTQKLLLFSELFSCPKPYQAALDLFCEAYANYLIVSNEEEAIQAIMSLDKSKVGKAQFFVLNQFVTKPLSTEAHIEAKQILEVLKYEKKYEPLLTTIFHNVWITEKDLQNKAVPPQQTWLSTDGKFLKKKELLIGGHPGAVDASRIGRKQNVENLQAELEALHELSQSWTDRLTQKRTSLQELQNEVAQNSTKATQQQLELYLREQVGLKTKLEQVQIALASVDERKEELYEKLSVVQDDIKELRPRLQNAEIDSDLAQKQLVLLQEKQELKASELSQKQTLFNDQTIEYNRTKNVIESIQKEINFKRNTFKGNKERSEQLTYDLHQTDTEIIRNKAESESLDSQLAELSGQKKSEQEQVAALESIYYEMRERVADTERLVREIMRQKDNCEARLSAWQSRMNELNLVLTGARERLKAEFELEINEEFLAVQDPEEDMDEKLLTEETQALKQQLQRLGNINQTALEAYQEVKTRHDFIELQRNDLLAAQATLEKTIEEIDQIAVRSFMEAFEQIRANFQMVFRSLFSEEDSCDLILTTPDTPLESQINIIAKPKGKRPLSIRQLSGGEKTLTATSLLFAVYLMRPAPFCVFDEVDAPLDDANIDKFNNIIKKFAQNVQFIIVTHNKRTMVSTDVIFGVTMVEQGVSRVIPMDLKRLALEQ
ncbi:MAG: chromosome segregation protein SMC [Cytophagales bacterium]|nr:MAG: chromosome segregation protein SMC [Cytophagales bacterium]TAF60771.1 MAG: chromosome segregation protein SMC [Cytophagales bacterium]